MDLWEELWARWCQEIRMLAPRNRNRRNAPTFYQIKYYASAPDLDGYAWLKPPTVLDFEDPTSFFNTDIIARLGLCLIVTIGKAL